MHAYLIEADVVAAASALAAATRSSIFMVMLSACYVLACQITGDTDLAIRALTAGRSEVQFQETMGTFINAVPFRIALSECATFRDVVKRTRETCIDAMAHELPVNVIEESFPEFIKSREDPRMTQFIISDFQSQFGDLFMPIAEGAREIHERLLQEPEHPDIPTGMVWNLDVMPSGDLSAGVLYNLDEFDESTAAGWGADYRRIVTGGVSEPDSDWRTL
jgi:non-ribosomal peptide synthetase component F